MFIYDLYSRKSSEFMQCNVYIRFIFEEVLRVYAMQCLYMIYIRGSPQSLCNAMFIHDLYSRKSSEFYAIQWLYTIYTRGSPQSFMQYNVYI